MASGDAAPAQMGAFLMGLKVRGETAQELAGGARALRAKVHKVRAPEGAIDIVGTGGDHHGTYNVSSCSAFVVAGGGRPAPPPRHPPLTLPAQPAPPARP